MEAIEFVRDNDASGMTVGAGCLIVLVRTSVQARKEEREERKGSKE